MQIVGDIETADKFFVYKEDRSIEWVPSLTLAKRYTLDITDKVWYNKTIHATTEGIVVLSDGRVFLQSEEGIVVLSDGRVFLQSEAPEDIQEIDHFEIFKTEAFRHIDNALKNLYTKYGYSSILDMLSWKSSTIKEKANHAKLMFTYRDKAYTFVNQFIEEFESELKSSTINTDLSHIYSKFLKEFPIIE